MEEAPPSMNFETVIRTFDSITQHAVTGPALFAAKVRPLNWPETRETETVVPFVTVFWRKRVDESWRLEQDRIVTHEAFVSAAFR
jgi:hypothetical protein